MLTKIAIFITDQFLHLFGSREGQAEQDGGQGNRVGGASHGAGGAGVGGGGTRQKTGQQYLPPRHHGRPGQNQQVSRQVPGPIEMSNIFAHLLGLNGGMGSPKN